MKVMENIIDYYLYLQDIHTEKAIPIMDCLESYFDYDRYGFARITQW